MAKRYAQLQILIEEFRPRVIVEIGAWKGKRALEMAEAAFRAAGDSYCELHYKGYDLFETASAESDAAELNVKAHHTRDAVASTLEAFAREHPGFTFELIEGNTRETLAPQAVDFAFIDGGHSVETIRSDLDRLRDSRVILLDDWYALDERGAGPDLEVYGCNRVLEGVPHEVLPVRDPIHGGGLVQMALIAPPLSRRARMKLAMLKTRTALRGPRPAPATPAAP